MDRKHTFLNDKLRYAKRKTTKREFNFIPINNTFSEAGDAPEQEQIFALSSPKWASSPRDTPSVSGLQKKKKFVDISLIEPISELKVDGSKPGTEQEDPTINLAALHAVQKASAKEKDFAEEEGSPSKNRVEKTKISKREDHSEEELEKDLQNLPNVQSVEKKADSKLKESKTDFISNAKTKSGVSKGSRKSKTSSDNDSEGSAKRSLQLSQKSNKSSKALKSQRSRSSSQSSGVEGPENRVPKTSNVNLYKNYKEPKESGGSASEGSLSRRKRSKNQDEVEVVSKRYSQKLSESNKSTSDFVNSADEKHLAKRQRVSKRSSDSEKRSTEEDIVKRRKSNEVLSKFEELAAASIYSVQKRRKSSDKSSNKFEKSSGSEKSTPGSQTVGKKSSTKSSSTEKSTSRRRAVENKTSARSSSSEKSTAGHQAIEKKTTARSSSSEKSTSKGRSVGKKPITRTSSSEKSTSGRRAVKKKTTARSSSSEKSTSGRRAVKKKTTARSSSFEKSTSGRRAVKKKTTARSSSSEKSTSGRRAVGKKSTARSSSSEKSSRRAVEKKTTTRSRSSEKSSSRGQSVGKKSITRSSSSEKLNEAGSVRKRQSSSSLKSAPPTRRVISTQNNESEISPGEGTSKRENVPEIFQDKSNQSTSSTGLEKFTAQLLSIDFSSDDDLFNPQKPKVSKKQVTSNKGAKFKETVKPKPKKVHPQSSGADLSSDEELSTQMHKVAKQHISSIDGKKFGSKRATKRKADSAISNKEKLKKSLENLPQLRSKPQTISNSDYDSEKNLRQSESKHLEKTSFKDKSGEMSEEIPLQNRTVITTFAGLPLLDSESDGSDEHREDQTDKLEESIMNLGEILDPTKLKLKKIYDTSWELKLKLLQPTENEKTRLKNTISDLDVIWNFLGRSLHMIIKETNDLEKRTLLKAMKTSLEEQFLSEISKQQQRKEMHQTLKDKTQQLHLLTNKLLYLKQRNRQLAQTIYESKVEEPPQKKDDILDKFQDICKSFAQFKRN